MPRLIKLTPQQLAALNETRRMLTDLVYEIDQYEKCGGECALFRQQLADLQAALAALVANFS